MGLKRESMALSEEEKEVVAYHEGGHAVLGLRARARRPRAQGDDPPHRHGARRHPAAAGRGAPHLQARSTSPTRSSCGWAGASPRSSCSATCRPARRTTSSACTELARKMVREWGMSDRIGPMAWGSQGAVFLGEDLVHTRDYSDETARVIDEEVERILRDEENRARKVLAEHRAGLEAVAAGAARARDARRRRGRRPRRRGDGPQGRRSPPGSCAPTAPRTSPSHCPRASRSATSPSSAARSTRVSHRVIDPAADASSLESLERAESGSGLAPGARSSATAAQRSVALNAPDERALHHAVGVGDDRHRDGGDARSAGGDHRVARPRSRTSRRRVDSSTASFGGSPRHESQAADENSATSHGASGRGKSARSSWRGHGIHVARRGLGRASAQEPRDRDHDHEDRRPRSRARPAISPSRRRSRGSPA